MAVNHLFARAIMKLPQFADEGLDLVIIGVTLNLFDCGSQLFQHLQHDCVCDPFFFLNLPSAISHIRRRLTRVLRATARGSSVSIVAAVALAVFLSQTACRPKTSVRFNR
jgi:hypothetical protein